MTYGGREVDYQRPSLVQNVGVHLQDESTWKIQSQCWERRDYAGIYGGLGEDDELGTKSSTCSHQVMEQ